MNEMYTWRMFSDIRMSHKELELRWFHTKSDPAYEGTAVTLAFYFSPTWQRLLSDGPKWVLREACTYLCTRIKTADRISYKWHIETWNGDEILFSETVKCMKA